MSELRQRRGEPQEQGTEAAGTTSEDTELSTRTKEEVMADAEKMLEKIKAGPKPGISHEAKKWKDELAQDPYNMELIFQLGLAYAKDQQWDKCANVMLRGFKRVNEFEDKAVKDAYLMTLCQASMSQEKFRQALMVFNDIEEPEDDELLHRYEALKCYVFCSNGDASAGLKAFHKSIENQEFDTAVGNWALCYPGLQKVGAVEVTRSTLEAMATTEAMKKRLELVELIRNFKATASKEKDQAAQSKSFIQKVTAVILLVFFCVCMYFLYDIETRNLQKMKIKM